MGPRGARNREAGRGVSGEGCGSRGTESRLGSHGSIVRREGEIMCKGAADNSQGLAKQGKSVVILAIIRGEIA